MKLLDWMDAIVHSIFFVPVLRLFAILGCAGGMLEFLVLIHHHWNAMPYGQHFNAIVILVMYPLLLMHYLTKPKANAFSAVLVLLSYHLLSTIILLMLSIDR
jgi:hypothetical protein